MPQPSPEMELLSVTALCDFTKELGATRVVPGSRRWEPDRWPEPHEFADTEMPGRRLPRLWALWRPGVRVWLAWGRGRSVEG